MYVIEEIILEMLSDYELWCLACNIDVDFKQLHLFKKLIIEDTNYLGLNHYKLYKCKFPVDLANTLRTILRSDMPMDRFCPKTIAITNSIARVLKTTTYDVNPELDLGDPSDESDVRLSYSSDSE